MTQSPLINYINSRLNVGFKEIVVTPEMVEQATPEEREEAHQLCALAGAKLLVR